MDEVGLKDALAYYCLACDYRLTGLERGRCPECDRAFDLNDYRTLRIPRIEAMLRRVGEMVFEINENASLRTCVLSFASMSASRRNEVFARMIDAMRKDGQPVAVIDLVESLCFEPVFDAVITSLRSGR